MTDNSNNTPRLRFPGFSGEWDYVNGNELFEPVSNKNHNSDLPILALTQDQGAVPRDMINYNVIASDKSVAGYKVVEVDDFIISLRSFQGGIEYSRYKGLCSPAYIVLKKKNTELSSDFYRIYFKSYNYIQALNRNLEGIRDGKMISYQQFSEIKLPAPSPAEQNKIASFLSSMDDVITEQKQKVEALKEKKKGLMQQLFPQQSETTPRLRFPGFSGEWEERSMDDVFTRITRRNSDNNQNVLTISAQYGLINQLEFFNKNIASSDVTGYYLLHKGEFAYNKSSSQGRLVGAIKPLKLYDKGVVSTLYICFKCNNPQEIDYWEQYFDAGVFDKEIMTIAQEGARNHGLLNIPTNDFFNLKVKSPTLAEQQKIASCLSSLDSMIGSEQSKLDVLKEHKKGLMQQLFPQPSK